MQKLVLTCALLFFTLSALASIADARSFLKRQAGDVKAAEILALMALENRLPGEPCLEVACGLVDIETSGRKKRDTRNIQRYQKLRSLIKRATKSSMPQ